MAAKGIIAVDASNPKFRGIIPAGGWTLCVGAGLSRDFAPTWFELTREIVNESFGSTFDDAAFDSLVAGSGWNLDAWIQAAANEFIIQGRSLADFNNLLETLLYGRLRKAASGTAIEKHLMRVLNSPISAEKNRMLEVCEFLEAQYGSSSLLDLVHVLIDAANADRRPRAIITFNADTFLETLLFLFARRDHYNGPGPHSHPRYHYKPVNRPSHVKNYRGQERTNIFHCHGTIMPREFTGAKPKDSRDRLVFLEQEYLRIASTSAAWPETLFLYHAQTTKMVFVGLSMADANIRRWMSASEIELGLDRQQIASVKRVNPEHLWIMERPSDKVLERIKLVSLVHLGVRPALIDNWTHLGNSMRNMLAL